MSGFSMRSSKVTTIDSSGEVKSFESSSKQVYSASFGGGDTQMLEDSSVSELSPGANRVHVRMVSASRLVAIAFRRLITCDSQLMMTSSQFARSAR